MASSPPIKYGLILFELDNLAINNYWRKYSTYLEIGWDAESIKAYLAQKDKILQIASFNTNTVSFSASSRRNRFYEIYNRSDMLEKDVAEPGCINALNQLVEKYDVHIISSRSDDMKEKTLQIMKKQGFPMEKLCVYFKDTNAILHTYRKDCILKVKQKNPAGVAICLNPEDAATFESLSYTPVGFTSLKNFEEFNGKIPAVFQDWNQLLTSLMSA